MQINKKTGFPASIAKRPTTHICIREIQQKKSTLFALLSVESHDIRTFIILIDREGLPNSSKGGGDIYTQTL